MKETLMLDLYKGRQKVAEQDITSYSTEKLGKLLLIQARLYDRTWKYRKVVKREEEADNFIPLSETAERVEGGKK